MTTMNADLTDARRHLDSALECLYRASQHAPSLTELHALRDVRLGILAKQRQIEALREVAR